MHGDHDQTWSEEAVSTSSNEHNDHDQEQSEEAASTSSRENNDAMVGILVGMFVNNVFKDVNDKNKQ